MLPKYNNLIVGEYNLCVVDHNSLKGIRDLESLEGSKSLESLVGLESLITKVS